MRGHASLRAYRQQRSLNLFFNIVCTCFVTNEEISPLRLLTTFIMLDVRYEYSSLGMRNTVSILSSSFLFINAIWNSYSKSETARNPLIIADAPFSFEYEFQMALMNRKLDDKIETVFLMPSEEYSYLTSTIIKVVSSFIGDIS